jgi:O-antigen/teichoic acid export membrane protein
MGESVLFAIARRSSVSGAIRLAGIALSLGVLLAIARAISAADFGTFSLLFSLAMILGYGANLGQHVAILRFWPAIADRHGSAAADGILGISFGLTIFGAVAAGLIATALGGLEILIAAIGARPADLVWTGALAAMFALAEFCASALRAKGRVVFALGPRDIVWRVLVILLAFFWTAGLGAQQALALVALSLLLAIAPQIFILARDASRGRGADLPAGELRRLLNATRTLWLSTSTTPVIEYATTVIVGLVLGPVAAGGYFAADRLARLLGAGLASIEQVVAPEISRAYHRGDLAGTAHIARITSMMGFVIAVIGATVLLSFGHIALALFDPSFTDVYFALVVLIAGQLIHALCGANALLLNMAGQERILLVIRLIWGALTVVLAWAGAANFGIIGAALASTCVLIGWNLSAVLACRSRLGIWTLFIPRAGT